MEIAPLASKIYGLCAGYGGISPARAAALTSQVLTHLSMQTSRPEESRPLVISAARHLMSELQKLSDVSDTLDPDWEFNGRLLVAVQALHGLLRSDRLLLLLRDQWGLSIVDLADCFDCSAVEISTRLKKAALHWQQHIQFVLGKKKRLP